MTRAPVFILLILIVMWCVLGYAVWTAEPAGATAGVHEVHPQMRVSGDGPQRDAGLWKAGLAFAWCIALLITVCLVMSVGGDARMDTARKVVIACAVPWLATFAWLCWAFEKYVTEGDRTFLGPFPLPTTVMFLIWLSPMLLIVVYLAAFRRWFVTDEQVARFNAMMAAKGSDQAEEEQT